MPLSVRFARPVRIAMGAALASSLAMALPAVAQQPPGADAGGLAQDGHHARGGEARRAPELTLKAQATAQIPQDTVTITLVTEHEGKTQAEVGQKLTAALNAAMPGAKASETVQARNGAYSVWAMTNREGKVTGWRGRAEILLESRKFGDAAELAGKLADTMPVGNIVFSLSNEARAEQEGKLLAEAAQAFRDRALAAASAFGFKGYQIRKLDLGGGGDVYMQRSPAPRYDGGVALSSMAKAEVPLQPDMVSVSVQVNGTVYLQ